MNEVNKNSINENSLFKTPLTKSNLGISKEKLSPRHQILRQTENLSLPKINNINNKTPILYNKNQLPPVKPNFVIHRTSTSDNTYRQNYCQNHLTIKTPGNNYNNCIETIKSENLILNHCSTGDLNQKNYYYNRNNNLNYYKSELKVIKDENENEKVAMNSHMRNLQLIKRLVEKRKKEIEENIELNNRNNKSPMERYDLFKKSLLNNGIAIIPHKKLEPINLNDPKNIDDNTTYYYKIIHEGNSSVVIEECLKRRGHWKVFTGEEKHYVNSMPSNNGSFIELNHNILPENNFPNFLWSHCSSRIDFNDFHRVKPGMMKRVTNHFEFHTEISNKLNLFINMMTFCESNNYDLFSMLPMTFPIKYESEYFLFKISAFTNIFNNITKYISDKHLDYKYIDLFN